MSQENVELVRAGFDLPLEGDLDAFEDWVTSDVVVVQPPEVPDAKTYEGSAAVAKAWQDWPNQWEDFRLDLVDLADVGENVVISETRHRGRGRESGIEMDFRVFYVHRLRHGKLPRLEMFFSREQALEAVGLSEQDAHADF
jgi:ketosteroid isomerase-like protein